MDDRKAKEVRRYIGKRIKHARALEDQSQLQLARRLSEYTGQEWSREMIANLETGRKLIPVETLCAIASVQGQSVAWYFADAPSTLSDVIPG